MGMRGRQYGRAVTHSLGELGVPNPPRWSTVWDGRAKGDGEALEEALPGRAGKEEEGARVDGTHLLGSGMGGMRRIGGMGAKSAL